MAHEAGALLVMDGAQAGPKLPVDMPSLGADFYARTGHKMYGPTGIGVLYGRRELLDEMPPFIGGGSMIKKVGATATRARLPAQIRGRHLADRRGDRLRRGRHLAPAPRPRRGPRRRGRADRVRARAPAEAEGVGSGPPPARSAAGIISFELRGVHGHDVAEILDRHGVAVRAGHHCAQVLMERLGVPATTRASFAVYNTRDEVDRLVEALADARGIFGG